jgi:hypothetical protein
MQLTIDLPSEIGARVAQLPNRDNFIINALQVALLMLERDKRSLDEIALEMTAEAKRNGLTDEKLQELLQD